MSYSKVDQNTDISLIDHSTGVEADLILQDTISAQPYVLTDIEPDYSQSANAGSSAPNSGTFSGNNTNKNNTNNHNNASIFQVAYYRQFFDLDTETFVYKLKRAMNPFDKSFSMQDNNTELYGFFWITATLITLMFISATGSNILRRWVHGSFELNGPYEYNFNLLSLSIVLFYGYNLLVPVGLYAITSWGLKFPNRLPLAQVISIYGYTNVLWIPITLLNIIFAVAINGSTNGHGMLLDVTEWTIVSLSGVITGVSNLMKISPIIQQNCLILEEGNPEINSKRYHLILLGALAFCHLIFTILVKISYFGSD